MPAAPRRTPADRKTPLKKGEFAFEADGKRYVLPPAAGAIAKMSGRAMRDLALEDDGELKLIFTMLECLDIPKATLDALYDLPLADTLTVARDWMSAGDGLGASLGESLRSSN